MDRRPGGHVIRARKYAKWTLLAFGGLATLSLALMLAGFDTPGMAWYRYN
ncbi:hypothetical protein OM960_13225 [Defluviimonas sp. CAU 1641]|uniref:Uncharacterized protein n=2 Tax=Defluviimonas salinarum TaxID=2992147 RepID=A0ABT3J4D5_9RHOB|nr:hypothetical protein [Defluviimonas salinarum]